MKTEINFNESVYDKQIEILQKEAYKKEKKYYKNSGLFSFIIFSCSILLIINDNNFGYFVLILGILSLFNYGIFKIKKYRIKNKLKKESRIIKEIYSKNPKVLLEVTNENFNYSNFESKITIKWENFESYRIIENHIILITKSYDPFIFGKSELGENNYNQLVNLITTKCKN